MKIITNFRHAEGTDFGTFERDGKTSTFNNVSILTLDRADTDWYEGKPEINKIPYELLERTLGQGFKLTDLIGKAIIIEKEAKVFQGKLSEKVTAIYFMN